MPSELWQGKEEDIMWGNVIEMIYGLAILAGDWTVERALCP